MSPTVAYTVLLLILVFLHHIMVKFIIYCKILFVKRTVLNEYVQDTVDAASLKGTILGDRPRTLFFLSLSISSLIVFLFAVIAIPLALINNFILPVVAIFYIVAISILLKTARISQIQKIKIKSSVNGGLRSKLIFKKGTSEARFMRFSFISSGVSLVLTILAVIIFKALS